MCKHHLGNNERQHTVTEPGCRQGTCDTNSIPLDTVGQYRLKLSLHLSPYFPSTVPPTPWIRTWPLQRPSPGTRPGSGSSTTTDERSCSLRTPILPTWPSLSVKSVSASRAVRSPSSLRTSTNSTAVPAPKTCWRSMVSKINTVRCFHAGCLVICDCCGSRRRRRFFGYLWWSW